MSPMAVVILAVLAGLLLWFGKMVFTRLGERSEGPEVPLVSATLSPADYAKDAEHVYAPPVPDALVTSTPVASVGPPVVITVEGEGHTGGGMAVEGRRPPATPSCVVYCRDLRYCEELERRNATCVVEWPEE